ncbi:unnamed protein product [Polarella glacialis]|uniref:Uncharacterized protein n=1 Tax=Polarella glacialis TaxID=89957 RepID=A0A813GET1_POLGL|nr:unnamed protein product [Polarella glacialis]
MEHALFDIKGVVRHLQRSRRPSLFLRPGKDGSLTSLCERCIASTNNAIPRYRREGLRSFKNSFTFETTAVQWDSSQDEQGKSCPNASKLYKCTLAMDGEARACCPHPASVSRAALWKPPVALQGVLAHGNTNAQEKGVGSVALNGLRKTYNVAQSVLRAPVSKMMCHRPTLKQRDCTHARKGVHIPPAWKESCRPKRNCQLTCFLISKCFAQSALELVENGSLGSLSRQTSTAVTAMRVWRRTGRAHLLMVDAFHARPTAQLHARTSRSAATKSQTYVATQTSLGHAGHLMRRRMHSNINCAMHPSSH